MKNKDMNWLNNGKLDDSCISNICVVAYFSTPFRITIVLRSVRDKFKHIETSKKFDIDRLSWMQWRNILNPSECMN